MDKYNPGRAAKRAELKRRLVEFHGGACQECGYKKYLGALQFHHKDPAKKKFGLGEWLCHNFEILKEEFKKCNLLCANCHAEEEAGI